MINDGIRALRVSCQTKKDFSDWRTIKTVFYRLIVSQVRNPRNGKNSFLMVYDSLVCESQELLTIGEKEERSITMNIIDKLSEKRCVRTTFAWFLPRSINCTIPEEMYLKFLLPLVFFNSALIHRIFSFLPVCQKYDEQKINLRDRNKRENDCLLFQDFLFYIETPRSKD